MSFKNFRICDRVALGALVLSVLLTVVGFAPGGFLPTAAFKGYILIVGVMVAFAAWLIGRLLEGTFRFPRSPLMLALLGMFAVFLVSALAFRTPTLTLFGEAFEQGTFVVIAMLLLTLFLSSVLVTSERGARWFLRTTFGIYIVLALYQILHIFLPTATAFGVFFERVGTPVGGWSDFAIISGAALIGSMLINEFTKPSRRDRIISIVGGVFALFFVALANLLLVWVFVGLAALSILIYKLLSTRNDENRKFPVVAFVVTLLALLFILANNLIGGFLAYVFDASFVRINPTLQATWQVARDSFMAHPILGAGPNRFAHEWLVYHPLAVNMHSLWDVPFSSGVSMLGTIAVLGGSFGILAVLFFIGAFKYEVIRKIFRPMSTSNNGMLVLAVFVCALYFLASILFFSPGISISILAFAFMGILIGLLTGDGRIRMQSVPFLQDQRAGFFSIVAIVFLLIVSASTVYAVTERFVAQIYYQKGIKSASVGDLAKADRRLVQAISLTDMPVFERGRVNIAEESLRQILAGVTETTSADTLRGAVQDAIAIGNDSARKAIDLDPRDPTNYIALGDLMKIPAFMKVPDAFNAAKEAYDFAIAEAPEYPKTYLKLAGLYLDAKDYVLTEEYIAKALALKSNYSDAFLLRAQMQLEQENTPAAIQTLSDAIARDSRNAELYFQLGLLRFDTKDYSGAVTVLRQAITLDGNYLNAWYVLALADIQVGNREEAITILQALSERFPDNTTVAAALQSARLGAPVGTVDQLPTTSNDTE